MTIAFNSCLIYRLLLVLLLCFWRADLAIAQTGVHCSNDLMKLYRIQIPHAKLFKTEASTENPQNLCTSVYKISGAYARTAETILFKKYGMNKLIFECCGWFPKNGQKGYFRRSHRIASGEIAFYTISMYSEETIEKQWDKIKSFYIVLSIDAA